jgi:hypothetical protein
VDVDFVVVLDVDFVNVVDAVDVLDTVDVLDVVVVNPTHVLISILRMQDERDSVVIKDV